MGENDHRQIPRDSLFVMAELRIDGGGGDHRVRVRNLSPGGLMAEGNVKVLRGQVIWINLRNLGWTEGSVAWVQENRFGVAFRDEVDPRMVMAGTAQQVPQPDLVVNRPAYYSQSQIEPYVEGQVRKI
ncbi:MAG: hypothetical protein RIQ99_425 [Pseudomonadota bacterium]|jgi:hypothetical protein